MLVCCLVLCIVLTYGNVIAYYSIRNELWFGSSLFYVKSKSHKYESAKNITNQNLFSLSKVNSMSSDTIYK